MVDRIEVLELRLTLDSDDFSEVGSEVAVIWVLLLLRPSSLMLLMLRLLYNFRLCLGDLVDDRIDWALWWLFLEEIEIRA